MTETSVLPELRRSLTDTRLPSGDAGTDVRAGETAARPARPTLNVLCRQLDQLEVVLQQFADRDAALPQWGVVYVDFADIREYREAIQRGQAAGVDVWPATPRIQKPGEMGLFHAMRKHDPPGVLIRNLSGLSFFQAAGVSVVGDFSLNVTNELTADHLMRMGLTRVTASYDMNRDQLLDLVDVVPPQWLETVIHQHMPMFHMEHCVFCSVLSPGTNKHNCGRPCDDHRVELRDRIGLEHPLTADVGCRNTLFNATPQSSAEVTPLLWDRGLSCFRVELLYDDAPRIRRVLSLYRRLLARSD